MTAQDGGQRPRAAPAADARGQRAGVALALVSAASFGAMAIFAKLAYDAGASVVETLGLRFAIAALAMWALVAALRLPLPSRRTVAAGLVLGGAIYTAQSGLFFASLERIDASLASLLLYAYPALVTVAAFALGRERPDRRKVLALTSASAGVALVLLAAGGGTLDVAGALLALGAAAVYATYLLAADRVLEGTHAVTLGAIAFSAATASYAAVGAATGQLPTGLEASAIGWIVAMALVSTVVAAGTAFAALERVGPSTTAILATFEPVVTVVLAALVFAERLSPLQLAGGALVLAAVVLLAPRRVASPARWRSRSARPSSPSSPSLAPLSPTAPAGPTSPSGTAFAASRSSTATTSTSSRATAAR